MTKVAAWIKTPARAIVRSSQLAVDRVRWGREYAQVGQNFDHAVHIREAAEWLKRAQDAGTDRGVSYGAILGGPFLPSYPETTGYIIPTMLELADHYGDPDFERRAIEMGDWEIAVQMDCGAVMGGRVDSRPTPAVFNTGQVLLGWAALFRRTREERFRAAARRAIDWLLENQDPDGNWRRGNSNFAHAHSTVYNVKGAWGMVEAGLAADWPDAVAGGVRSAEYVSHARRRMGGLPIAAWEMPSAPCFIRSDTRCRDWSASAEPSDARTWSMLRDERRTASYA